MTTQTIYKGHNSPFMVAITDINGAKYTASRMATITRAYIKYINATGGTPEYADSAEIAHVECFDWATFAETGYMLIDVGPLDLTAGRDVSVELVVYDPTWPLGRMVTLLDLLVTEDAEDTPAPIAPATSTTLPPLTVDDDYQVLIVDCYRPSIRLDAATLKTMTMPEMSESYDGIKCRFIAESIGGLMRIFGDSAHVADLTHYYLTTDEQFASILLEYSYNKNIWIPIEGVRHWSPS